MSQLLMPSTDAMITLENVNKWYGQFHVLKNINLKVKQVRGADVSGSLLTNCQTQITVELEQ